MSRSNKQDIINASIDLFAEIGISEVSITKIAERVGATRGKIYHYFKRGKPDIITAILHIFDDFVSKNTPKPIEWETMFADPESILVSFILRPSADDAHKLRKIIRIIMANMWFDDRIKQYAMDFLISDWETLLVECFAALTRNRKTGAMEAEGLARFFHRYLMACAMEDALRYPNTHDDRYTISRQERMVRDCAVFVSCLLQLDN